MEYRISRVSKSAKRIKECCECGNPVGSPYFRVLNGHGEIFNVCTDCVFAKYAAAHTNGKGVSWGRIAAIVKKIFKLAA